MVQILFPEIIMKKLLPIFIISVILFLSFNSYAYQDNTFYYQSDSSWKFERNGRGYCWVCCYAMIINNISGVNVTPPDIAYVNSLHNDDPAMCYHYDIVNTFGMEFEPAVSKESVYFKDYEGSMKKKDIIEYADKHFGTNSGIIQQHLFYNMRENMI